jgi:hypothetical protein
MMVEEHVHNELHVHQEIEGLLAVDTEVGFEAQMREIRGEVLEAAANPVGELVTAIGEGLARRAEAASGKAGKAREIAAKRAAEARMKGFEGDACGGCGNFTLVRNGTCLKCNTCGSTSGCS